MGIHNGSALHNRSIEYDMNASSGDIIGGNTTTKPARGAPLGEVTGHLHAIPLGRLQYVLILLTFVMLIIFPRFNSFFCCCNFYGNVPTMLNLSPNIHVRYEFDWLRHPDRWLHCLFVKSDRMSWRLHKNSRAGNHMVLYVYTNAWPDGTLLLSVQEGGWTPE